MTFGLLIEMRDTVRATNDRIDGTNVHLDKLTDRMDGTNVRLDKLDEGLDGTNASLDRLNVSVDKLEIGLVDLQEAVAASEVRTMIAINELGDAIRSVHTMLVERL